MSKELSLGQKVDISKIYYNFCGLGDVLFSMPALNVAGKVESLVLHQEFRETGKRKFMNLASDEHLVRFHIGLEDPNDLIADIKQALRHLR